MNFFFLHVARDRPQVKTGPQRYAHADSVLIGISAVSVFITCWSL